jgi:crotonobetainyl-CoA:carnitine CoA-transferase CaiB-like acyl-CoA transferase
MLAQVPRGDGSTQVQMACPVKFSEGLPAPRHIGVAVGAHTQQVLTEAGFSAQEIQSMGEAGVFG